MVSNWTSWKYATLVYYFHFLGLKVTLGIFMTLKYEAQKCALFFIFLKLVALNYITTIPPPYCYRNYRVFMMSNWL